MKKQAVNAEFGVRVKALRARAGVDQKWLAAEVGCAVNTVYLWESHAVNPSAETLHRLAVAFGVTMDELWCGGGRCGGPDSGPEDAVTLAEAAALCGLSVSTVRRRYLSGDLKGPGPAAAKPRRVSRAELRKFMERHGIPTDRMAGAGRREG